MSSSGRSERNRLEGMGKNLRRGLVFESGVAPTVFWQRPAICGVS
jgi:hypothetical protein